MGSYYVFSKNSVHVSQNGSVVQSTNSEVNVSTSGSGTSSSTRTSQSSRSSVNSSSTNQEIALTLQATNLQQANVLSITAPANTRLNGYIKANGTVIQNLRGNQVSIDLSPYFAKGTRTVEISGQYQPSSASVQIEFSGPGTNVSHQVQGNGILSQILTVEII